MGRLLVSATREAVVSAFSDTVETSDLLLCTRGYGFPVCPMYTLSRFRWVNAWDLEASRYPGLLEPFKLSSRITD